MRKILLTLLVGIAFVLSATAQDRVISGRVTNSQDAALEGVSVATSDGKAGTQTDKDGNYRITVTSTARSLIFSYVNFQTVSRSVGRSTQIDVSMTSTEINMEEVVVVGYGVQQKKSFTGSASKVDAKEFAQLISPSIDRQLAGRATGVNVNTNASQGQVNAPARIRIRGLNSIDNNLSPLIVVDGTPISTGNLALISNSNALGDINPNDIETIDVLKDGSATAIYGSRGANGVILITTKKGAKGRTTLTYDGVYGNSSPLKRFELLNAQQFVTIANEKKINAGQLPVAVMPADGTNTNWQNNIFVNNALSTSHTLAISGGNDKSTFYTSLNYAENRGIIRTNKNVSVRLRANAETQINKLIRIGNNLAVSRQDDYDQNTGTNALSGAVIAAIRAMPNVPVYDATHPTGYNILAGGNALGGYSNLQAADDNYVNIAFVLDKNRLNSEQYRIIDNAFIELSPFKGFKFRSQIGLDVYMDYSTQILDPRHGDGFGPQGSIFQGEQNILNSNLQNYANYNFSIKKHNVYLTAGHELQRARVKTFTANGSTISDLFYMKEGLITNSALNQSVGGSFDRTALESLFGRLNYDYKNTYFIQASARRDGQSSLAPGRRYGFFPGASIGWRPVQEKFFKSIPFLAKNVSEFKLKASYAVVGNRLGAYPWLSTYGSRPYASLGGLGASLVGNPDLRWERSKKYDYGVEMGLFNNRLNIVFDYYKNDIDDLVLAVPTPYSVGIPGNSIRQNIGRITNKGVELAIDASVIRTKNFEWRVFGNYTHVSNEIKSLFSVGGVPTTEIFPTNFNIHRVGESLFSIFGYEYAGVNSGNGNPVYLNKDGRFVQRNIANGTYYFANSMNDPTLGDVTTLTNADKRILGSAIPTSFGAFGTTVAYKQLSLDVMFRYQMGNKILNRTKQEMLMHMKFGNNGKEILDRWTTPGQVTNVPKVVYNQDAVINQLNEATSRFVEKGDFLRLQNVVLSYNFNSERIQSLTNNAIRSARFFVQAQNVAIWTNYSGIDPEAFGDNGQDVGVAPPVRNVSMGISIGL
jgi:TonB-linked SusC/RagA family outer membrane protein